MVKYEELLGFKAFTKGGDKSRFKPTTRNNFIRTINGIQNLL